MIKKFSLCALAVCSAVSGISAYAADDNFQLEQVLMMSRHNLRAPLADNGSVLAQSTKKAWPQWDVPGGQLTTKGGVLEVYMGRYTREWLVQQGVLKGGQCPGSDEVYAYANSLQRTVATAQFFITGAFPGCDIPVSHQDEMGTMDPVFNPVITDDSDAFSKQALTAMNSAAGQLALKPAFQRLEKITDYKNAEACNGKKQCDLSGGNQNKFSADKGKEPGVTGPLKVGNSLVDAFTLQYYEGMPLDQVAWGQIKTAEQWKELSAIKNAYQDTLFTSPEVARNVAAPLVDYIRSVFVDEDKASAPKVTLMVGHDSNIASLLTALNFKPYTLPEQNERTPIGGMIQFQRWHDRKNNQELVKVEYVYQTSDQLRNATPLTLDTPPKRVTLEMSGCKTDVNGFCPWDQFTQVLNNALQGTPVAAEQPQQPAFTTAPVAVKQSAGDAVSDRAAAKQAEPAKPSAGKEKDLTDKAAKESDTRSKNGDNDKPVKKASSQQPAADKAS
ncbi:bifunctional glucose-1-phosphatase/inositol phosphatase [Erwinia psidii]|uniref:Bifunctional glucose-1-phosphatase/inositol phosphatase n=1 Tax=Erwinia psidii TaxID=69224 RepID=A0A3N6TSB1_9GAMM|nr:bifunctional glucose-1-phosphatase/inositol phosphatase [Erwinia psidii]MCX8957440.1 bifunctional glucose-1-phosphatase/inositol phosphatase [Erwinia psidii]MCX8959809.1 bifunctional glucose-1-phosphatase/inositol phosphatase [Erwinia psidii]MCX8964753.1 bifunctional glucose-1-phosphatase/inositol phosphatase [Erwinia psidii]RQM38142.1 bifunctional glucose-1-phosphatase/inositol phosphatase [Erwinia psidii]